jgi:hypothetical protein
MGFLYEYQCLTVSFNVQGIVGKSAYFYLTIIYKIQHTNCLVMKKALQGEINVLLSGHSIPKSSYYLSRIE